MNELWDVLPFEQIKISASGKIKIKTLCPIIKKETSRRLSIIINDIDSLNLERFLKEKHDIVYEEYHVISNVIYKVLIRQAIEDKRFNCFIRNIEFREIWVDIDSLPDDLFYRKKIIESIKETVEKCELAKGHVHNIAPELLSLITSLDEHADTWLSLDYGDFCFPSSSSHSQNFRVRCYPSYVMCGNLPCYDYYMKETTKYQSPFRDITCDIDFDVAKKLSSKTVKEVLPQGYLLFYAKETREYISNLLIYATINSGLRIEGILKEIECFFFPLEFKFIMARGDHSLKSTSHRFSTLDDVDKSSLTKANIKDLLTKDWNDKLKPGLLSLESQSLFKSPLVEVARFSPCCDLRQKGSFKE